MKNLAKLIIFLIYTILIFFIQNYYMLLLIAIINLILMIILKINFKKALANLMRNYCNYIIYSDN